MAMRHQARLPQVPASTHRYRLVGATLIDGTGADPQADAEIEVEAGRIAYAGPRRPAPATADVPVADLTGRTVLPGFIDCHVHLALDLELPPAVQQARFASEETLATAATARATLLAGVTTARDLGGLDAGFRTAIAAGTILGPRLHLALTALSPTGGHCDMHLPNGAELPRLTPPGTVSIVDSDDDMRRAVRLLARGGADVVKVCTTGGVSSPTDSPDDLGVPERHVRIAVEEMGRRHGQPVASHAQGSAGILEALRGGVRSIEHGYQIDDDGIALMLRQGVCLVPTLSSALRLPNPDAVPQWLYEKKTRWSAIAREHLTRAFAAGVTVAMGTDSGVCPHGTNLTELSHLVSLGLTPMAAIVAGTGTAAQLVGLQEHIGTLAPGRLADLVVTGVDPLADIAALADPGAVAVVVQGGRVVKDRHGWLPHPVVTTPLG